MKAEPKLKITSQKIGFSWKLSLCVIFKATVLVCRRIMSLFYFLFWNVALIQTSISLTTCPALWDFQIYSSCHRLTGKLHTGQITCHRANYYFIYSLSCFSALAPDPHNMNLSWFSICRKLHSGVLGRFLVAANHMTAFWN